MQYQTAQQVSSNSSTNAGISAGRVYQPRTRQAGAQTNVNATSQSIAKTQTTSFDKTAFSSFVEAFFTLAIIFSCAMFPFAFAQMFLPEMMGALMLFPFSLLTIPYAIVMIFIGVKVAGMFGCSLWERLTTVRG